jgi:hypothetical protein
MKAALLDFGYKLGNPHVGKQFRREHSLCMTLNRPPQMESG